MTREIGLNNPMGLKQSSDRFQGEVQPSKDDVFKQFVTMVEGVRAGGKVLLTYFEIHGLNTLAGIISRWAPNSENNTEAYIDDVSERTGYDPDEVLDLTKPDVLKTLVAAVIWHENGEAIDPLLISDAVLLTYA